MKVLMLDTETYANKDKGQKSGLYGDIRLMQFKWLDGEAFYYDVKKHPHTLQLGIDLIEEADLVVIHNAFYDMNLNELIGTNIKKIFDTRQAARYDAPHEESFDLKSCLERYDIGTKGEEGKSDWGGDLTPKQIRYAIDDVVLLEKLYKKVQHVSSNPAFDLDMKNYLYSFNYSHTGFKVHNPNRLVLLEQARIDFAAKELELHKSINFNSPKQVCEYFGIPKSDVEALTRLARTNPQAQVVLDLRSLYKKISTLEKKWNYDRIMGIFKPGQANSGRWTCSKRENKNPQYQNLQQLDRSMKSAFGYEDDNELYLVDADYSSLEMFTAAAVFRSETMMQLLYDGVDLHRYTASKALDKPMSEVTKDERQMAKGLNFGTLYGAGAKVVQIFIMTYTGKELPIKEVKKLRKAWLETYPDIKEYHSMIGSHVTDGRGLLTYTPLGRPIWANTYTEAINGPAQGFGAEVTKIALWLLYKKFPDIKVVNTVHDSISLEVEGLEESKTMAIELKKILDESWVIAKGFVQEPSELLAKLVMDNEATVSKVYEGESLFTVG